MKINRRNVLALLGAILGGSGLAAANGMTGPETEGEDADEPNDNDATDRDGKNEANERRDENEQEGENEGSDGNDGAEGNEGDDNGSVGSVKLSEAEARTIATDQVAGSVTRVELEVEDAPKYRGTPVYNVIVKTGGGSLKEVTLDANSGDVLKVENE